MCISVITGMLARLGGPGGETHPIAALGSLILAAPLTNSYPAGCPVDIYPPPDDPATTAAPAPVSDDNGGGERGFGSSSLTLLTSFIPSLPSLPSLPPLFGASHVSLPLVSLSLPPAPPLVSLSTGYDALRPEFFF